jgi:hypothetical protein
MPLRYPLRSNAGYRRCDPSRSGLPCQPPWDFQPRTVLSNVRVTAPFLTGARVKCPIDLALRGTFPHPRCADGPLPPTCGGNLPPSIGWALMGPMSTSPAKTSTAVRSGIRRSVRRKLAKKRTNSPAKLGTIGCSVTRAPPSPPQH